MRKTGSLKRFESDRLLSAGSSKARRSRSDSVGCPRKSLLAQAGFVQGMEIDSVARIKYVPEKGNPLDIYMAKFLSKYPCILRV